MRRKTVFEYYDFARYPLLLKDKQTSAYILGSQGKSVPR